MLQGREASFDDTPDDVNVDAEVLVDQDVSEGSDAPPGNRWMLLPEVKRQISNPFLTASPMTSKFRITASCTMVSERNARRPPAV